MLKNFKKNGKELFLEEAVLDDLAQDLDYLELPLSGKAFKFMSLVGLLVVTAVFSEVVFLGILKKDFYSYRALANASQIITVRSERGVILDRFGKPLSGNIPAFRLNLKLGEFLKNEKDKKETIKILESILSFESGYIDNLLSNVNLERQNILTIARKLSVEQVIKLKNLNLPGVQVEDDFERKYPEGEAFSHVLGFTGPVDKNDLAQDSSLALNDIIGKMGLEAYYDKELKGEDGETVNYRNAKGEVIGQKILKKSAPGGEIYSTLDADLQKYFYERLKARLGFINSKAGVGIAINPTSGEVLSLISLPSFNNNKIEAENLVDATKPLFNRAISGAYSPGSTIKPLVALAALKENIIDPLKKILSIGYIEIPNPYNPDMPSRFVDWKAHGWVDLYSALARSSNVYFYEVGGGFQDQRGLGINKLKEYWQKFGLGEKTGIDLPSENSGFLPDPESKEKDGRGIWRIGDTYNVSIGQGDLLVTPLGLINYIAAIANNGKIYKPFVIKKIVSHSGQVIMENNPQILKDISGDFGGYFKDVQKGMIDGVEKAYGTSHSLADLPMSLAAKTGSSQIDNNTKTNAFFVGYAPAFAEASAGKPADNPQVAILVLIENAKEGSLNAVPVAKEVLEWYYENRIK